MTDFSRGPSSEPRAVVRFVLDGRVIELPSVDPTRTVLEVLREDLQRTGTKEGCAEGDCGACTVVLGELDADGALQHRAVNACIQLAPTLDGKQLVTVESLAGPDGALHPVQRALVEHHGSQCGFCTPGIVMSLYALHRSNPRPTRAAVDDALSGNLCRCTGYRSIVAAAQAAASYEADGQRAPGSEQAACAQLARLQRKGTLHIDHEEARYYAPTRLPELAEIFLREAPHAHLVAGCTDVGLWVTKQQRRLPVIVYLGDVPELQTVRATESEFEIGAGVSVARAAHALTADYPELSELFMRFASPPIRNAATLCGNIGSGSPIGDSMPVLIALDARLRLLRGTRERELPLEAFYVGYQQNALEPGELITSVIVPRPRPGYIVRTYKVSKRFDQDISAVCGAFALQLEDGRVGRARVAYGGVAATVARAPRCEQALQGAAWNEATVRAAMRALDDDYQPIGDMRASAAYRKQVTRNLLYRLFLETTAGPLPSVYAHGRPSHG